MGYYLLSGQERFKENVKRLCCGGRFPSSVIITGEQGMGKKTAAAYMAAALLCEQGDTPCGSCASCRMVKKGAHPDFISVSPSGKSGAYLLESDLRPMIAEAYIKPNQSRYKVVLLADIDNSRIETQNVLLKLVEEPPSHLVIIMTARSRDSFLKTILSRVSAFTLDIEGYDSCMTAARENVGGSFSTEIFDEAYRAFGGNIGQIIAFMGDKNLRRAVEAAKKITQALCVKDEYTLLMALGDLSSQKETAAAALRLLAEVFRDAVIFRQICYAGDGEDREKALMAMRSCAKDEASALGQRISGTKGARLYELCEEYLARLTGNANLSLLLNAFCAQAVEII